MEKKLYNQRGDTIVEVLIALVVVSSILTGVYFLARNSLIQDRQAQERTEGLKLVEGQVEALRASASRANSNIFTQTSFFCMLGNDQVAGIYAGASPPAGSSFPLSTDQASQYPNPGPNVCSAMTDTIGTSDIVFNLSIDPCSPAVANTTPDCSSAIGVSNPTGPELTPSTPNLFIVRARWDSATGTGREEAKLLYRIYPFGLSAVVGGGGGSPPPLDPCIALQTTVNNTPGSAFYTFGTSRNYEKPPVMWFDNPAQDALYPYAVGNAWRWPDDAAAAAQPPPPLGEGPTTAYWASWHSEAYIVGADNFQFPNAATTTYEVYLVSNNPTPDPAVNPASNPSFYLGFIDANHAIIPDPSNPDNNPNNPANKALTTGTSSVSGPAVNGYYETDAGPITITATEAAAIKGVKMVWAGNPTLGAQSFPVSSHMFYSITEPPDDAAHNLWTGHVSPVCVAFVFKS